MSGYFQDSIQGDARYLLCRTDARIKFSLILLQHVTGEVDGCGIRSQGQDALLITSDVAHTPPLICIPYYHLGTCQH